MHRSLSFSLLTVACLAPSLGAQAVNEFGQYPGATTFTTRGGLNGGSDGYFVWRVDATTDLILAAQTDIGGSIAGRANGFRVVCQDQDASTQETFNYAILPDDAAAPGQPAQPSVATPPIFETAPQMTPAGSGISAWIITTTLATPFDGVPQTTTYHLGVKMGMRATWTMDGYSVHTAFMPGFGTGGSGSGMNCNAFAPIHTHTVDVTSPGVAPTGQLESPRVYILTEGSVLNLGADIDPTQRFGSSPNPNYGRAGMWPDRVRQDGIAWRLFDGANSGATAFLLGSFNGFAPTNFPLVAGQLAINIAPFGLYVFDTQTLSASGQYSGVLPWAAFPFAFPAGFPAVTVQAFTVSPGPLGLLRASNGTQSNP